MSAVNVSGVQGMLYPSCYDVLRHWTMPEERSRTGTTVLTGKALTTLHYTNVINAPSGCIYGLSGDFSDLSCPTP